MVMARYSGFGTIPRKGKWSGALQWHCEAYWEDASAPHPSVLVLSLQAQNGHARIREARLDVTAGLEHSHLIYAMEAFKVGGGFYRQKTKVDVTLRYEGANGGQVFLSGRFRERGAVRPFSHDFTLSGGLVELGDCHPPVKKAAIAKGPCQIKHLAVMLEPTLKRLAYEVQLPKDEVEQFQKLFAEYRAAGRCSTQQCHSGNCGLRLQADWLAFYGYKDMRDALDFEKSGLHSNPPKLRERPGIETLKLSGLKQPGHYNP